MSEKILLLIEGEHTERIFFDNLKRKFWKKDIEFVSLRCNIYSLYQLMKMYDFDIETEKAILEAPSCSEEDKKKVRGKTFSTKYLVFDFDFQEKSLTHEEKLNAITKMIELFNNDSEYGLLFINYPMFESIREPYNIRNIETFVFNPSSGISYKNHIDNKGNKLDFDKLQHEDYCKLITQSLSMTNYILNNSFSVSKETLNEETASKLFEKQVAKLEKENVIYCINSAVQIPCYYFGQKILKKL